MSVRVAMLSGKGPLARREKSVARNRISRNPPCPCGSGKKYKHCCYGKGVEDDGEIQWRKDFLRQIGYKQ
jgi:hypothetical protein